MIRLDVTLDVMCCVSFAVTGWTSYFAIIFHLRGTVPQALASLTKLLEYNNISIVAQELLGESKEEIHESPIKILKVGSTD